MHESSTQQDHTSGRAYLLGVVLVLGAAVLWSLNGALIKLTYMEGKGPNGVIIAFYRSLFAGLFIVPLARGKLHTLRRRDGPVPRLGLRPTALGCVVFFTLMTVCFVVATTKTEAANVIILQYTSTFWVFGLSPWVLGEKPRAGDLWILGLAIAGIIIIFVGSASTDLVGLLNALGSGLFFGLLTMMIRRMRDSDSAAVTVVNTLGSALLILPFAVVIGGLALTMRSTVLLVIMGVVQFGLPYYLFSLGLVRVPAYQASLIALAEPILVPLWTYLAVREKPPGTTMIGGGVVLLALIIFILSARRAPSPPKTS